MSTFISLINFTDQGIRNIKESPNRAGAFKEVAEKLGVTVKDMYWTMGNYDLVIVLDGADEAVTTAILSAGALGNVRSQTLRAYTAEETNRIIGNIP